MKNRLQLNWELPTAKERIEFLSRYMEGLPFEPSPAELETCAAYVLWGFDEDGKTANKKVNTTSAANVSRGHKKNPLLSTNS